MGFLVQLPLRPGKRAELASFLDEFDGRGGVRDTEFVNFQLRLDLSFEVFADESSVYLFVESKATSLGLRERRELSDARNEAGVGGEFLRTIEDCTGVSLQWPSPELQSKPSLYTFWCP